MNSNLNNNVKLLNDSSKEEIGSKKSYENYWGNENEINNAQNNNSFNYSLNTIYNENDSLNKIKKSTSTQIKEKTYYHFINAILLDDKSEAEKLLNTSQSPVMINHPSIEGFTPIQYAVLYGSISCFKFLLSLKAYTGKTVEGLHLIHLSLARAIYKKEKEKCKEMFNYIYEKLPEQKNFVDRLGRTYLHVIFEYDFNEALDKININIDELFKEDYNGEYVINYVYIYNSNECFWKVAKDPEFLAKIYLETRKRYENNKSAKYILKEKFLDNLFIHQNFYAIAIIVMNCINFIDELLEDLNNLNNYYTTIEESKKDFEQKSIMQMKENINFALNTVLKIKNNINFEGKFHFPQKIMAYTAIVYNNNCIQHIKLPDEIVKHLMTRSQIFENSDRLACLIGKENGILLNDQIFHYQGDNFDNFNNNENMDKKNDNFSGCKYMKFFESHRKSKLNDILKCHDYKYIQNLREFCNINKNGNNNSSNNNKKKEFSPKKEKGIKTNININISISSNPLYKSLITNNNNYKQLDSDTYVNEYSYENIYNTTGCVFDAIDIVMHGQAKNALVLIRPPGHHAGYYGQVDNPEVTSSGFCIVNNVAIGGAYAKNVYRDKIKKIAIFDFDVHHGNGTEEIIQMLNYKTFIKSFTYDKICSFTTKNTQQINWLDFDDAKNILYISTHIYDENNPNSFYPYSGGVESNTPKDSPIYPGGIYNIPFKLKKNISYEYRDILRAKVIPRLYKFKPDFIFLSAGFDGHENEIINQHNMFLNEFDYAFITQQIQFVANKFAEGRVISVLEGGYNISTGIISSFSQSVFTHARFLNLSLNMFNCFDVKLTGLKRKYEMNDDIEIYNRSNIFKNRIKSNKNYINEEAPQNDEY